MSREFSEQRGSNENEDFDSQNVSMDPPLLLIILSIPFSRLQNVGILEMNVNDKNQFASHVLYLSLRKILRR